MCQWKVTPNSVVATFAGTTNVLGFANGSAYSAKFNYPFGVTVDNNGDVYIADRFNHAIQRITPKGEVSTCLYRRWRNHYDSKEYASIALSTLPKKFFNEHAESPSLTRAFL